MFGINKNNQKIFSFIGKYDNDLIKQFSKKDLAQLFIYLRKYFLEYRQELNVAKNLTFGTEIEFIQEPVSATFNWILEIIMADQTNVDGYTCTTDGSLSVGGLEVQSPIMNNTTNTWIEFEKILDFLQAIGSIDETCSAHIHIGTTALNNDLQVWRNFFLLWSTYEKIIIRFFDGEFIRHRDLYFQNDRPMSQKMWEVYNLINPQTNQIDDMVNLVCSSRYQAVNFQNITDFNEQALKNTIEFRSPNGSLNPIIWQNNINLLLNLLEYCNNPHFDEQLILQRRQSLINDHNNEYTEYLKIDVEATLEFCDLIFKNNLDKIYFLKQYLKDLRSESCTEFIKVPRFTYQKKIKKERFK